VSRNWCLRQFITRLGSRIYDLRKEGWKLYAHNSGGDYIYQVLSKPDLKPPTRQNPAPTSVLTPERVNSATLPQKHSQGALFPLRRIFK